MADERIQYGVKNQGCEQPSTRQGRINSQKIGQPAEERDLAGASCP